MAKKKKRRQVERAKPRPNRVKMIRESDWYESRVVAPLYRRLRRAQLRGNHSLIDEIWGELEEARKQHRIFRDRNTFMKRP
jgi:hypothetical protein